MTEVHETADTDTWVTLHILVFKLYLNLSNLHQCGWFVCAIEAEEWNMLFLFLGAKKRSPHQRRVQSENGQLLGNWWKIKRQTVSRLQQPEDFHLTCRWTWGLHWKSNVVERGMNFKDPPDGFTSKMSHMIRTSRSVWLCVFLLWRAVVSWLGSLHF